MATKVVVHSNAKRLVQVVCVAVLIAVSLLVLKKFSVWWNSSETTPTHVVSVPTDDRVSDLITGPGSVIDGDTLDINGVKIRLEGIDAPELKQRCGSAEEEWSCGQQAATALRDWLGERSVSCKSTGKDRYQRTLARCFVSTDDVQAWLVLNGWALAYRQYSKDYVAAEEVAQIRKAGIWRAEFMPPWQWRGN